MQCGIPCFEIGGVNLQALTYPRENSSATSKDLPSGADLAAPLSSDSYAKPKFIGSQNSRDGKHSVAMIKNFRALLDDSEGARHRVTIYTGTREFIKLTSYNRTYILDEQLHAMELSIYDGIEVQVEGLEGDHISQIGRCIGSHSGCGGDRRNDWAWVKQQPGRCYGALNGRLLWQLERQFKIKLLNEDEAFVEY